MSPASKGGVLLTGCVFRWASCPANVEQLAAAFGQGVGGLGAAGGPAGGALQLSMGDAPLRLESNGRLVLAGRAVLGPGSWAVRGLSDAPGA